MSGSSDGVKKGHGHDEVRSLPCFVLRVGDGVDGHVL